jgi:hypothetical protein
LRVAIVGLKFVDYKLLIIPGCCHKGQVHKIF